MKETASMQVRYVPRRVVFKAERAGTFSLYYRALGGAPPPKPVEELKTPPERFVEASLGPELETSLPEIPPLSILLGGAMPATDFSVKREVRIPEGGPNLVERIGTRLSRDREGGRREAGQSALTLGGTAASGPPIEQQAGRRRPTDG